LIGPRVFGVFFFFCLVFFFLVCGQVPFRGRRPAPRPPPLFFFFLRFRFLFLWLFFFFPPLLRADPVWLVRFVPLCPPFSGSAGVPGLFPGERDRPRGAWEFPLKSPPCFSRVLESRTRKITKCRDNGTPIATLAPPRGGRPPPNPRPPPFFLEKKKLILKNTWNCLGVFFLALFLPGTTTPEPGRAPPPPGGPKF